MEMQIRVLGARQFNDTIEGKAYNFTKLRLEMPVPRNSKTECGTNVVEAIFGEASAYAEVSKIKFPCMCMVDLENTSRGFDVYSCKAVPGTGKA